MPVESAIQESSADADENRLAAIANLQQGINIYFEGFKKLILEKKDDVQAVLLEF